MANILTLFVFKFYFMAFSFWTDFHAKITST